MRDAGQPRHLEGRVGELLAMDQHHGARILADELELGHRQPPVQRQEDRAQPPAGELQLEDVGVVHAQHRHAIAAADAKGGGEPQRRARDSRVELGVGEAPAGRQIVCRLRARRKARVMARSSPPPEYPTSYVSPALPSAAELPTGVGLCPSQRTPPVCTSKDRHGHFRAMARRSARARSISRHTFWLGSASRG